MSLDAWLTLASRPLHRAQDLDPLLEAIGDRRVVLLGEASHGTREFYEWRTEVTRRLVAEKGFRFVAVEGDWPACREVDRHVRGQAHAQPEDALRAFGRWPSWMWANQETVELAGWMRSWNDHVDEARRAGFYGLDVYSLWESLDAVLAWLEESGHPASEAAERALRCFEPYARDEQDYARATTWVPESCQEEVVRLLSEMRPAGGAAQDADAFDAEQNALVAKNAEAYYRAMVRSGAESWNLRDRHMMDTLDRLLARHGKGVVWAHNTHVGDARATDMKDEGMLNLGQLARERHGDDAFAVGFTTFEGHVVAARTWGAPMREMRVPPAEEKSWERRLHEALGHDALLLTRDAPHEALRWRGHRAIGVVYHPEREAWGNYVPTSLPRRYDAVIHVERSSAVRPLWASPMDLAEPPETWPFGE
ncbi:MAG TPA: erythromycin esterase family protein [Candidatus Thermoplasmatota archaeon]|nr:erythromycin esterase family protein [Candidatus Thermoplasmatota archaeon]